MVKEPLKAIYNDRSWGPTFGKYDLRINRGGTGQHRGSFTDLGKYYPVPSEVRDSKTVLAGAQVFVPDEVEVFYLV